MGSSVILPAPGQPGKGPDAHFKTATLPTLVSFALNNIGPPSPLYIQRDDTLFLQCTSSRAGGDTFTFFWRFLQAAPDVAGQPDTPAGSQVPTPGGLITQTVKTQSQQIIVAQDATNQVLIPLAEGYLLSLDVVVTNAATRGQSFARAVLARGLATSVNPHQPLFADYCTKNMTPGWPTGRNLSGSESTGAVLSFQVANPAAGADWILTVPGTRRFAIQSFAATIVTSAAVANRNVQIIVDDGANVVWTHSVPAAIPASTTDTIVGTGTNAPAGVITTIQAVVLPPGLRLFAGMRIRSLTGNIQAADQWSNIWFLIEQWIDV